MLGAQYPSVSSLVFKKHSTLDLGAVRKCSSTDVERLIESQDSYTSFESTDSPSTNTEQLPGGQSASAKLACFVGTVDGFPVDPGSEGMGMGSWVGEAGRPVGSAVDWAVGSRLDGACVCFCVGSLVVYDGIVDGFSVGVTDGSSDGLGDGFADGASDGAADVGRRVDGDCIGDADGTTVGFAVGSSVGLLVVG